MLVLVWFFVCFVGVCLFVCFVSFFLFGVIADYLIISFQCFAITVTVVMCNKQGLFISSCNYHMLTRYSYLVSLFKINKDCPKAKCHF